MSIGAHHYDSLNRQSSSDDKPDFVLDYGAFTPVRRRADSPPISRAGAHARVQKAGWLVPALILGPLLAGVITAIGHHIWLTKLDGLRVDQKEFGLSETWIRTVGNGIAYLVKISLCISLGTALTQVVWYDLRRSSFSIAQLDALFALPGPIKMSTCVGIWHKVLPAIVISLAMAAAPLISVRAPTALGIAPAGEQSTMIDVPNLQLDSAQQLGSVTLEAGRYYSPSQSWLKVVQSALMSSTAPSWNTPSACTNGCHYTVNYAAPAINCSTIDASQISELTTWSGEDGSGQNGTDPSQVPQIQHPAAYLGNWNYSDSGFIYQYQYNSTNSLNLPREATLPQNGTFEMTIGYSPISFSAGGTFDPTATGVHCTFHNATYEAFVAYANSTQKTTTSVTSWNSPIQLDTTAQGFEFNQTHATDSRLGPVNYLAIAHAFAQTFAGTLSSWSDVDSSSGGSSITFSINSTRMAMTPLFQLDDVNNSFSAVQQPGLRTGLMDLFSNMTLGFMAQDQGSAHVPGAVVLPYNVWSYQARVLWMVYGIAIGVTAVCAAAGLFCLFANGAPGTSDFSRLLAATRNPSLDTLSDGIRPSEGGISEQVMKTQLRYDRVVVDGMPREGFVVQHTDTIGLIQRSL